MTLSRLIAASGTLLATSSAAICSVDMFAGLSNQMLNVDAISVVAVAEFEVLQEVECENDTLLSGAVFKGAVEYDYDGSDWRYYSHVDEQLTTAMSVEAIKRNDELTCIDYEAGYANTIPMLGDTQPEGGFLRLPVFSVFDYLTPFDQESLIAPTVPSIKSTLIQTTSQQYTWAAASEGGRQLFTTSMDLDTTHSISDQSLTITTLQAEPERPFRYDYIHKATGQPMLRIEFTNYQTVTDANNESSVWPLSIQQTVYGADGQPAIVATYTVQSIVVNNQPISADRIDSREIPEGIQQYYESVPVDAED